jgi:FdhE protein
MAEWLRFMAGLSRAQDRAVARLPTPLAPDEAWVARAVAVRMPPYAAVGHRPHPIWREGLSSLVQQADDPALPEPAKRVTNTLRAADPAALDVLANQCLRDDIARPQTGEALFVRTALEVYFARAAASLDVRSLRLLQQRGLCPVCGCAPVSGVVTASGRSSGARYLYCSLCATAWNHARAVCIKCGGSRSLTLQEIEGSNGSVKAETCGECHSYAKMLYEAKDPQVDPVADDLATLGLDILVGGIP